MKLEAEYYEEEEKYFEKADEARKWLANEKNEATLSEFDLQRVKLLEEYEEREKYLGWSGELYDTFLLKLRKIDDKEAEDKKKKLREIQDAEIANQLAVIDLREKSFQISEAEAGGRRVELKEQELSSLRQQYKELTGVEGKELERLKILKEIKEIEGSIVDLNQKQEKFTGTFTSGMSKGLKGYLRELKTNFEWGVEIADATAKAMQDSFSNLFFDAFKGKLKSWKDYFMSILDAIMKKLSDMLAQWLLFGQNKGGGTAGGLWGLVSSLGGAIFGSGGGGTGQATFDWMATVPGLQGQHTGGFVRHGGGYVPRFHFGGLNPDERLVVNKVGERYITQEQNDWLTKVVNTFKGSGQSLTVSVPITIDSGNKKMISELRTEMEKTAIRVIRRHL